MSLFIAAIDGSEISKWIFIFFFFILPILRSILNKSEKAKQRAGQTEAEADDFDFELDEEDDYSGGEAWERLLRGEEPAMKVEPTPTATGRGVNPVPLYGAVEPADRGTLAQLRKPGEISPNEALHETVTHITGLQSKSALVSETSEELSTSFALLEDRTEVPNFDRANRRSRRGVDWKEAIRTREILGLPVALRAGAAELPGFR